MESTIPDCNVAGTDPSTLRYKSDGKTGRGIRPDRVVVVRVKFVVLGEKDRFAVESQRLLNQSRCRTVAVEKLAGSSD